MLSFRSFDGIGSSTDVIVHDVWYRCYCTYTYVVFMVHFFFNSGMENRILFYNILEQKKKKQKTMLQIVSTISSTTSGT